MHYELDPIAQQVAARALPQSFAQSLGLPLLAEGERVDNLWKSLDGALAQSPCAQLLLLFVNQRASDGEEICASNRRCLEFFGAPLTEKFSYRALGEHGLLVVNGTDAWQLEEHEGVGRARKVLGDIALGFFRRGQVGDWHRQTDGDAKVPADYFQTTLAKSCVAGTYPYLHSQGELSAEEFAQLQHYERWLESYTEGLQRAGSRYAFWPLGSTLMFSLAAYEKVRGVPNVRAGEDFHFLSKLAKLGRIERLATSPIELRGRHSTRVPFGTGRALLKMKSGEKAYEEFPPQLFDELRQRLAGLDALATGQSLEAFYRGLPEKDFLFFTELRVGFEKILRQKTSVAQKQRQLHESFDALKTMRWINLNLQRADVAAKSRANSSA